MCPPFPQLSITATDRGASPRSSHVNLRVDVIDINDNSPQFATVSPSLSPSSSSCHVAHYLFVISQSVITGQVLEGVNNAQIIVLEATDADGPGPNSETEYFITSML